jgi:hypothetical protein
MDWSFQQKFLQVSNLFVALQNMQAFFFFFNSAFYYFRRGSFQGGRGRCFRACAVQTG